VQIDGSGYGCFLHIAGLGTTYRLSANIKSKSSFPAHIDAALVKRFGFVAPAVRYGPLNYNDLSLELFINSLAQFQALLGLILKAQYSGLAIVYRDGFGAMFVAGLDPSQGPLSNQPPLYRVVQIKLVQIPDTTAPSVPQGSAMGFPTLTNGSVPALDPAELLI
jgi:hypothetical protein